MRALVMAAGLGTRLRPLTDTLPKPLVPVRGRPMVEYVLGNLARAGVAEAIVNIHYLPEKMRAFAEAWNRGGGLPALRIQDESGGILGSGGAVALAAEWLFERGSCALICNADVIGTPDLGALAERHRRLAATRGVECTLSLMRHPGAGVKYNGLRREGDLVVSFGKGALPAGGFWHFPGYYAIGAEIRGRLSGTAGSFSIVEKVWEPLAREGKLGAWEYTGPYFDLGTVEDLKKAEEAIEESDKRAGEAG
jgi:NDP-sugar pyrophosphorylase family protein